MAYALFPLELLAISCISFSNESRQDFKCKFCLILSEDNIFNFTFYFFAEIPENDYIKYFGPDFSLKIPNGHIVCISQQSSVYYFYLFRLFFNFKIDSGFRFGISCLNFDTSNYIGYMIKYYYYNFSLDFALCSEVYTVSLFFFFEMIRKI